MAWFYAINDQKHGPLPAAEIAKLSRGGGLKADHLVWREGIDDWQPLRKVAGEIFAEADDSNTDAPVETAVCAFSNRVLPKSDLVPYGDQWIDPQHKDAFVQQLMETGEARGEIEEAAECIPVGFWWRVLSSFIDYLVLFIPSMIFMIPYWVSSAGANIATDPENPFNGWTAATVITYLVGLFGSLATNASYHTWMLGKYRATLGKMAIGAIVANPDGSRFGYGRAFGRWACKNFLNGIIMGICGGIGMALGIGIMIGMGVSFEGGSEGEEVRAILGGMFLMFGLMLAGFVVGLFPYWMAAFDKEKRGLHDRICSTRVVKKQ